MTRLARGMFVVGNASSPGQWKALHRAWDQLKEQAPTDPAAATVINAAVNRANELLMAMDMMDLKEVKIEPPNYSPQLLGVHDSELEGKPALEPEPVALTAADIEAVAQGHPSRSAAASDRVYVDTAAQLNGWEQSWDSTGDCHQYVRGGNWINAWFRDNGSFSLAILNTPVADGVKTERIEDLLVRLTTADIG